MQWCFSDPRGGGNAPLVSMLFVFDFGSLVFGSFVLLFACVCVLLLFSRARAIDEQTGGGGGVWEYTQRVNYIFF